MLLDQSLRILVVEDESLLRWSLVEVLRRRGHAVLEAASAKTASEAMSRTSTPIDVALLDLRLPDASDLRLVEATQRHSPRSAVVLMTAYATPDVVHDALEKGVYRVISKPFDLNDVDALVQNAHRSRGAH